MNRTTETRNYISNHYFTVIRPNHVTYSIFLLTFSSRAPLCNGLEMATVTAHCHTGRDLPTQLNKIEAL